MFGGNFFFFFFLGPVFEGLPFMYGILSGICWKQILLTLFFFLLSSRFHKIPLLSKYSFYYERKFVCSTLNGKLISALFLSHSLLLSLLVGLNPNLLSRVEFVECWYDLDDWICTRNPLRTIRLCFPSDFFLFQSLVIVPKWVLLSL